MALWVLLLMLVTLVPVLMVSALNVWLFLAYLVQRARVRVCESMSKRVKVRESKQES